EREEAGARGSSAFGDVAEKERDREQAPSAEERQELLGEAEEGDEVDHAEEPEDQEASEPVAGLLACARGPVHGAGPGDASRGRRDVSTRLPARRATGGEENPSAGRPRGS